MSADNYKPLYETAASLIPQESKVVELGCGDGKFAAMIHKKCTIYTGIDTDKKALACARDAGAGLKFIEGDVTKLRWEEKGLTFVALEVLEHLRNDLIVLQRLPKGSRVIFSVPSFDSKDHRRHFPDEYEPLEYYSNVLDIDLWRKIRIPVGNGYFHVMRGWR